ncbi:MAG: hypothetical protein AAGD96_09030 [Chloroflexota bacterium]
MYFIASEAELITDSTETTNQPVYVVTRTDEKNTERKIDYRPQIYRCGIRNGSRVLVIGGTNFDLLQSLAKAVGYRGKIIVLEKNSENRLRLKHAHGGDLFAYVKPCSGDPAWDFRTDEEKYGRVNLEVVEGSLTNITVGEHEFDCVLLEDLEENEGA